MPKVGKMTFPYTAAGMKAAKKKAYKTGEKMESASQKKMEIKMGMRPIKKMGKKK